MNYLVAIVSGFASGVFLRSLFFTSWWPVFFVLLLATLFAIATFLKPRVLYSLGALFCIFMIFGMLRSALAENSPPDIFTNQLSERVSYDGVVVSDPDVRDANQRVPIRVSIQEESTIILAVVSRSSVTAVGDRVHVSGTLELPEPFSDNGGRVFRYDKYLERSGIRFLLNFASLRVIEEAPWYSMSSALARTKHAFLGGLSATLPEPYSSLASGVVIGGKTGLGSELQDAFIRSGLVQIIVLSGYNVMIVAEWVMAALAYLNLSKRRAAIAGSLAILIFVGIAGASATALRAMVMALIALYARATGHTYAASRALLFAVFAMLLWNPLFLVFDPGFGLSVVATAGLIWLASPLEELFVFIKNAFWKNAVATTLAAQIAVLPLLLYDTGNLSLVAIPANLLTMPVVPVAMGLSALAGFAGIFFDAMAPFLGIVLGFPAYLANAYLIWVARESAALPFAAFTLPLFPFWLVLLAYAVLIYIASSKRFSMTDQLRLEKNASI